ncbi:ABC transporter permease [Thermus filiformis]|uniref:Sugar ABC transporter permease n=1 Tax=Thermus filiformis TaxID=276 RepID=A0A0A2WRW6_THEFI|nr:ABC transporter permease [Thermus filiformis]KGQ21502.1 sugar ABC transporter permease [Thermus filiformis]
MRLEKDPNPSPLKQALALLLGLLLALFLLWPVLLVYGLGPDQALGALLDTLREPLGRAEVLRRSIPLLLIGSGLALAFRTGFFNIGAEGQLLLGAVGAGAVALFLPPGPWTLPLMFLLGGALGAAWAFLAAWLRAQRGVNEILSTLMLNYLAQYLVLYLVSGPWKGETARGFLYTDPFPPWAQLPTLGSSLVHWPTLLLGVVLALGLQVLLFRTPLGFELRVLGGNPLAARYLGLKEWRLLFALALLSGGLSGMAGVGEVAGIHHRLMEPAQISLGYGFTAVIVAWLARGHPALVLFTAPLMGVVLAAGDGLKLAYSVPFRVVDVVAGLILLALVVADRLSGYRWRK